MKNQGTSLYFIGALSSAKKVKAVKIGHAIDEARRLSELQIGNHLELILVAWIPMPSRLRAKDVERKTHYHFRKKHIRGEWFWGGKNVEAYISYVEERFGFKRGRVDDICDTPSSDMGQESD